MRVTPRLGRVLATALAALLLVPQASVAKPARAYLILDARSGRVLAAHNADLRLHPASLAKMMTLYLTFEALLHGKLGWSTKVPVSAHAASRPPTKLWARAGSFLTVREAVLGMIVRSANDAAVAIAEKLGRTERRFARMMTAKASALGMSRTLFTNASGLPDRRQVTTARDMSTLAVALINRFPADYRLFSTPRFEFRGHLVRGHNHLMYRYRGMDGIKTGYTRDSGFNIVSAVKQGYRRVIGVVMGGTTAHGRDATMAALLRRWVPKATPRKTPILVASVVRPRDDAAAGVGWEIQMTATSSRQAARAVLGRIRARFDATFADLVSYIAPVRHGDDTLYRARFAGFASRQAARDACATLQAHRFDCLALSPGE